jgi:CcmD family protein
MAFRIRALAFLAVLLVIVVAPVLAQPPAQPEQQTEFVPLDELPPQDQLPAAPLLIAAYAVLVLALFAYVVSVARRLAVVQREVQRLETDVKRGTRLP